MNGTIITVTLSMEAAHAAASTLESEATRQQRKAAKYRAEALVRSYHGLDPQPPMRLATRAQLLSDWAAEAAACIKAANATASHDEKYPPLAVNERVAHREDADWSDPQGTVVEANPDVYRVVWDGLHPDEGGAEGLLYNREELVGQRDADMKQNAHGGTR